MYICFILKDNFIDFFLFLFKTFSDIREYLLHRNDSELPLTQFKDQARIIFSQLCPSWQKFLFLKILLFSLLSQNFKSLPRKTTEIRPFTILAFSSGLFIHHLLLLLHHKTKFLRSISPKRCDIESWNMRQNV